MMRFFATLPKALLIMLLGGGILGTELSAKEPTNWLFGFGIGAGLSQFDLKFSDSVRTGAGTGVPGFQQLPDLSTKHWGVAWEFLVGYKHFLNDYVGFRYYANVGAQHYKGEMFKDDYIVTANKVKADIIEYTANADILLNFYNSELFTFGILGGFGIGGAYFDSPALKAFRNRFGPTANNPNNFAEHWFGKDLYTIKKHHLSASLSVGIRANIFQKIRNVEQRVCNNGADGRRTCRVPISYFEHSLEFNAKFNMLTYYPTKYGQLLGVNAANGGAYNAVTPRPGYEVKNPYKFTLRYIFAF